MKQIKVSEKCSGCGLCIVNCSYLRENADGNAEFIAGKSIGYDDLDDVKKVISECPQNALELVDTSSTNKKGKAGVQEIIENLKKEVENFKIPQITSDDIPFEREDYPIPVPDSNKEYDYIYKSFNAARSAAKDELYRLCWSESAYQPMIKRVFVGYKVKYLKPYYTLTDTEDSAYYKYNKQMREILANAYAEITELIGNKVPESWKEFSVYLNKNDGSMYYGLIHFEDKSEYSGVMSEFKTLGSSNINEVVSYMNIDLREEYVGTGFGGKPKYKEKYCFKNFRRAADSFVHGLSCAISIKFIGITNSTVHDINWLLQELEERIKKEMNNKISELEEYLK